MKFPQDLKYTQNDEWIRASGDTATVGISDYAQDALSDIVYVDYSAAPGATVSKGAGFGSVESVKAAADFYMPIDAEVIEVNKGLQQKPETLNSDPYGEGWLAKVKIKDASQLDGLMDAAAYEEFCNERKA